MQDSKNERRIIISVCLLAFYLVFTYLTDRFALFIDSQEPENRCLPWKVFILDSESRDFNRGDIVMFTTDKLEPYRNSSQMIAKVLAGVPGDTLTVSESGVRVADVDYGGLPLLGKLGKSAEHFEREEVVPKGKYVVLGLTPASYDSRYWGLLDKESVKGKAYALW